MGIKNLGICIYDFTSNTVVRWETVSLVTNGRYLPALNVQYVRDFVARFRVYFHNAFAILVERQMRCNMRIIEAVLQSMFYERCIIISARSVKAHYNLSTRNYRANKQKAVEWATSFVKHSPHVFSNDCQECLNCTRKSDDLADSLLLLMYYLDTYSNQLQL